MWNPNVVADLQLIASQHGTLDTIEKVIDRLEATGPALDGQEKNGSNPIKAFNDLYLRITKRVGDGLKPPSMFLDAPFMEQLDIEFAKLYFVAIDGSIVGNPVPEAWEYLFAEEYDTVRHSNLEGALLGVNAHINHDLTNALINAEKVLPNPADLTARKTDFDAINDIFRDETGPIAKGLIAELQNPLKKWLWQFLDWLLGGLDELAILAMIRASRNRAWKRAAQVWAGIPVDVEDDEFSAFLAALIAGSPLFSSLLAADQQLLLQASEQVLTTGTIDLVVPDPTRAVVRLARRPGDGIGVDTVVDRIELQALLTSDDFLESLKTAAAEGEDPELRRLIDDLELVRRDPGYPTDPSSLS